MRWQVASDVAAFREALGQANWERAVALHTAPLLATWRISDMPGIEEWLELEREALQAAWRDAALRQHKVLTRSILPTLHFQLRNIRSGECLSLACRKSLQNYLEAQRCKGLH